VLSNASGTETYVFNQTPTKRSPNTNEKPKVISRSVFKNQVHRIKKAIDLGLIKVVLSRITSKTITQSQQVGYFDRLCEAYPNAFVYHFEDESLGTWVGASPEILLRRVKNHFFTMSLAGTQKISENRKWTEKEQNEQLLVTDFICTELSAQNIETVEQMGPYDHVAGPVKHLRTDIGFDADPQFEKAFIQHLHPTPAVCGLPRNMAAEAILLVEEHDRELYSGFIGLFEPENTHCYVNLRCGKIIDEVLYAFVGAGITAESDPELEWLETENKSKTLFDLIEID
jgi:isochorismate synthase